MGAVNIFQLTRLNDISFTITLVVKIFLKILITQYMGNPFGIRPAVGITCVSRELFKIIQELEEQSLLCGLPRFNRKLG